jgi:hypothetical protein
VKKFSYDQFVTSTSSTASQTTAGGEPTNPADDNPAGGSAPRGRPSGCSERVIQMLRGAIREFGLSDSAAAVKVGMSPSTLSRWKYLCPEIALKLDEAREDFRERHLQIIMKAAEAENARGWRAAAWVLERIFPADYAARARDRAAHRRSEEFRREEDERNAFHAIAKEELAERDARAAEAERAAEAAQAAQTGAGAGAGEAEHRASTKEGDLHNVKNSAAPERGHEAGTPALALFTAKEGDLHNVQNSVRPQSAHQRG